MDKPKPVPRNKNTRNRKNRGRDQADYNTNQPHESHQQHPETQSPSMSSASPDIDELSTNDAVLSPIKPGKRSQVPEKRPFSPIPSSSTLPVPTVVKRGERLRTRQRDPQFSVEDDNDLDTSDLKRQIDRLERDLQRRDRELEEERVENEKGMEAIKRLERDKVDLKREVDGLRDEAEDYRRTLDEYKEQSSRVRSRPNGKRMANEIDSDDGDGYFAEGNGNPNQQTGFDITVKSKNREIEQLIKDTERLEEEKQALEEKLNSLKESLSEATRQIEAMTNDHFQSKSRLHQADERIKLLEEEKAVLSIRERELLGYKERHDQYLENLCNAVDIRVDVWKKMMFDKDEEIDRLTSKISTLMSQIPNTQLDSERTTMQLINHKLMEREHQIALLNEQLAQATEEIESGSILIESLQSKLNLTEDSKKTEQFVKSLQITVKKLEDKLDRRNKQLATVEKEAEDKSKTLTTFMGRMAAYESGEYGLPEAVSEIKDLKMQIRIRDKQVEGVTQEINVLQMQVSDLQEENEMLRDKLGLDSEADVNRETRRYARTKKNELSALRSKVAHLEEEVVTLKTRNYSLKKQLNQYDLGQQQVVSHPHPQSLGSFAPDRDRDGPDGGSVSSPKMGSASAVSTDAVTQADMFVRHLTGFGVKTDEWKEKYEIILEENSALRRGLHEILDCMHKMTDDGNTEVMIQAPVLEELLREMSARGIISYPYPISSFHMKVCNLEGKCSQLREELHRLRQDERQCRQELFEAQGIIQTMREQLSSKGPTEPDDYRPPHSRSRSPKSSSQQSSAKSRDKHVTFRRESVDPFSDNVDETANVFNNAQEQDPPPSSSPTPMMPTRRDYVLEDLQQEIQLLQNHNESLKQKVEQEKGQTIEQLLEVIEKANQLLRQKDGNPFADLKIEYLQAIRDNQTNEINSLIRKLADIENENSARLGYLERFKLKAIHQISTFQQILETSVPIHLFHNAKKEIRLLSDRLLELQEKEETLLVKTIAFHKNTEEITELRRERDKLEEELGKCQARLIETAANLEAQNDSKVTKPFSSPIKTSSTNLESQNSELSLKLNQTLRLNNSLKDQVEALEASRQQLETQLHQLHDQVTNSSRMEKEAREKCIDSVAREEYDLLVNKLVTTEESLVIARDNYLKWKELAEMTQNQIKAIENIKYFEKLELDYLAKQVVELQSQNNEKALLAKAHHHMLTADKDKHLAIQQVEKLLSKLSQLEAHSLQQSKVHQEREMSLISMHTHVIMRYRSLFSALHETQTNHWGHGTGRGKLSVSSSDLKGAFEMFEKTRNKCSELEDQILEERLKAEELEQKCQLLEGAVNSLKDGSGQEVVYESLQKVQEARVEIARWKRKAEQKDRDCVNLQESVHRLVSKTTELEEDCIKLEHTLELKDSLTSTLMAKSVEQLHLEMMPPQINPVQTLSSTSMPPMTVSSTMFDSNLTDEKHYQPDGADSETVDARETLTARDEISVQSLMMEKKELIQSLESFKIKVAELEGNVRAKEEALNEIRFIRSQQGRDIQRIPPSADSDLQDALVVARETISSLHERLKSKEDNVNQYRRLLAEVRTEMSTSTERHVQEMRALQMTIHQQQQAFTRMKSTLSQPVKDSMNVEGTIKDQMTRIHELEDEVSQLQHAMSNTAAQLTATRSEAHRWRCQAEAKIKEADSARDQNQTNLESLEELRSVRQELRDTFRKLDDAQQQIATMRTSSAREQAASMTDLVNLQRSELEQKDKQIDAYSKSLQNLKNSGTYSDKSSLEEKLNSREKELNILTEEIKELHKTIAAQQVKISKSKAVNQKTGASLELEDLRIKHRDLIEAKASTDKHLADINKMRDEEELKKIKSAESVARWEESKKWKKNLEKLESRIHELEGENDRFKRTSQNLRITITRMEKEKIILETKLNSKQNTSNSASTATDRFSSDLSQASQQAHILAQGAIAKLKMDYQDLQELNEKIEFEGKEEAERLKMEVKLLKERVVAQERHLTAYQIAQKGDAKVIAEIENMAMREAQFQKEIRRLEEDNLHLNLQIEQLRLESPRLRDRVQYLQKLIDALKAEKPLTVQGETVTNKKSQKSLGELEKTINALRQVIDKLQFENKKLKYRPPSLASSASTEKLKTSVDSIVEEKKLLVDKVQYLEHENEKLARKFVESNSNMECFESKFMDAEKRAKSAEMKLRTFLDDANKNSEPPSSVRQVEGERTSTNIPPTPPSNYDILVQKMQTMQEELNTKTRLLSAAKQSLRAAEKATAPKPTTSPRTRDDDHQLPVAAATSAYLALV